MSSCLEVAWKIIYLGVSFLHAIYTVAFLALIFFFFLVGEEAYSNSTASNNILNCNWSRVIDIGTGGSYFQPLSWSLRMKIALGAASGLAFLHSAEPKVIYRDFKASNILLDSVWLRLHLWTMFLNSWIPSDLWLSCASLFCCWFACLCFPELQCKTFWFWIGTGWTNWW